MFSLSKIAAVLKAELPNLSDGDVLSFDFSNVKFFTTLFFNVAFTSLLKEMPFDEVFHLVAKTQKDKNLRACRCANLFASKDKINMQ